MKRIIGTIVMLVWIPASLLVPNMFFIFEEKKIYGFSEEPISHQPIYINGDLNFTEENGVISGNGSAENPFLIAFWEIDGNGSYGIRIENTTKHFNVKGCTIHNATHTRDSCGILLLNVTNGLISDCNFIDCVKGIRGEKASNLSISNNTENSTLQDSSAIYLFDCNHFSVTGNSFQDRIGISSSSCFAIANNTVHDICCWGSSNGSIFNNAAGDIFISDSSNISVCYNNITSTEDFWGIGIGYGTDIFIHRNILTWSNYTDYLEGGITLWGMVVNVTLTENKLYNCSIWVKPEETIPNALGHLWIDETNLVNDYPIILIRNATNHTYSFSNRTLGEVILLSCRNVSITDTKIIGGGMYLWDCWNCSIRKNCISESVRAIYVDGIGEVSIEENIIHDIKGDGIVLRPNFAIPVKIRRNIIHTCESGCYIVGRNITIEDNFIYNNREEGIKGWAVGEFTIQKNTFLKNGCGIYLDGGYESLIINNSLIENEVGIGLGGGLDSCYHLLIYNNTFFENELQAFEATQPFCGGPNYWNSTNRGNYWSDWTSPDENMDGIVDIPYPVPSAVNAKDYFPLTVPPAITIIHHPILTSTTLNVTFVSKIISSKFSIKNVEIFYKASEENEWQRKKMNLSVGYSYGGEYTCTIKLPYTSSKCVNYYIFAEDEENNSASTYIFCLMIDLKIPASPILIGATQISEQEIVLSWLPPVFEGDAPILSYHIYRGLSPGTEKLYATVNASTTTFTDTNVSFGVTYYYYVTAINEFGESLPSNEVSATPLSMFSVSIAASKTTLHPGENTIISVIVKDAFTGSPINNATISLWAENLSGSFFPASGTVSKGSFSAIFHAGFGNETGKIFARVSGYGYVECLGEIAINIEPLRFLSISVEIKDCVEPGEQMQILVFVKDVYGNPVSNADVKVSGEQGIILPERNQTDSDGKAVFVCTAPFVEKTVLMKLRVVAEKEGWESGNGYASFTVVGIMAQKQEQVDLGIVGIVVLSVIMALEVWMGKRGGNHKRRQ